MTCPETKDCLLEVVYGEEIPIEVSFQVFRHLEECPECDGEFHQLLSTRDLFPHWQLDDVDLPAFQAERGGDRWVRFIRTVGSGGPWLQKIAAGVLILVGAISILQYAGVIGSPRVTVDQEELLQMVNDMIVLRQAEERKIIGQALVSFADEMDFRRQMDQEDLGAYLESIEYRYLENMEETNRYLRTLLSR